MIKLKSFCTAKETKQGEKTTLRMGENNSKWNNQQRINFQNIQAVHITQYQEKKNQKVGKRPKQTFLQRRHTWLTNTWKDCSTSFIIREMQIKTTRRYQLTLVRMVVIKKSTNNKCWRGCREKGHSCTVGRNVNSYSHYARWYGDSFKN